MGRGKKKVQETNSMHLKQGEKNKKLVLKKKKGVAWGKADQGERKKGNVSYLKKKGGKHKGEIEFSVVEKEKEIVIGIQCNAFRQRNKRRLSCYFQRGDGWWVSKEWGNGKNGTDRDYRAKNQKQGKPGVGKHRENSRTAKLPITPNEMEKKNKEKANY